MTLKAYAYRVNNATQVHTNIERLGLGLNGHAVTMRAGDMRVGGVVAGWYGVNVANVGETIEGGGGLTLLTLYLAKTVAPIGGATVEKILVYPPRC